MNKLLAWKTAVAVGRGSPSAGRSRPAPAGSPGVLPAGPGVLPAGPGVLRPEVAVAATAPGWSAAASTTTAATDRTETRGRSDATRSRQSGTAAASASAGGRNRRSSCAFLQRKEECERAWTFAQSFSLLYLVEALVICPESDPRTGCCPWRAVGVAASWLRPAASCRCCSRWKRLRSWAWETPSAGPRCSRGFSSSPARPFAPPRRGKSRYCTRE